MWKTNPRSISATVNEVQGVRISTDRTFAWRRRGYFQKELPHDIQQHLYGREGSKNALFTVKIVKLLPENKSLLCGHEGILSDQLITKAEVHLTSADGSIYCKLSTSLCLHCLKLVKPCRRSEILRDRPKFGLFLYPLHERVRIAFMQVLPYRCNIANSAFQELKADLISHCRSTAHYGSCLWSVTFIGELLMDCGIHSTSSSYWCQDTLTFQPRVSLIEMEKLRKRGGVLLDTGLLLAEDITIFLFVLEIDTEMTSFMGTIHIGDGCYMYSDWISRDTGKHIRVHDSCISLLQVSNSLHTRSSRSLTLTEPKVGLEYVSAPEELLKKISPKMHNSLLSLEKDWKQTPSMSLLLQPDYKATFPLCFCWALERQLPGLALALSNLLYCVLSTSERPRLLAAVMDGIAKIGDTLCSAACSSVRQEIERYRSVEKKLVFHRLDGVSSDSDWKEEAVFQHIENMLISYCTKQQTQRVTLQGCKRKRQVTEEVIASSMLQDMQRKQTEDQISSCVKKAAEERTRTRVAIALLYP